MKSRWLTPPGWIVTLVAALSFLLGGQFAASGSEEKTLQPGQTFRECSGCPEMVVIPPGHFLMGSSEEETRRDVKAALPSDEAGYAQKFMAHEHPQHLVEIKRSFAVSKYPVMRGQFAAFVRDTGYSMVAALFGQMTVIRSGEKLDGRAQDLSRLILNRWCA